MIRIDHRERDQCRAKKEIHNPGETKAKLEIQQPADNACERFNDRVAYGNFFPAMPALAAQKDVTQDRYVVAIRNRLPTLRTARSRMNDRFIEWDPGDTDIQETANSEPN